MPGLTGTLYQQFAITIAASVVFSAINALTLSPAFISAELPDAASLQRSKAVGRQIEAVLAGTGAVDSSVGIAGFSIMSNVSASNAVTFFDNNVYAQIGIIMLIGLAAKNTILIVEFAKMEHEKGTPFIEAAIEGARLRLRPILMTSFAFILGAVPLALATGSGAESRKVMGTAVVFGITIATLIGVFLIPACYALVMRLSGAEKSKLSVDNDESADAQSATDTG